MKTLSLGSTKARAKTRKTKKIKKTHSQFLTCSNARWTIPRWLGSLCDLVPGPEWDLNGEEKGEFAVENRLFD